MISSSMIQSLVEAHFEVVPERSNEREITILCGLCRDSSGNRGINRKTGLTSCWRCGNGGSLTSYARKVGIELDLVEDIEGATVDELEASLNEVENPENVNSIDTVVTEISLPKNFIPLTYDGTDSYHRMAAGMAKRKRLTLEDLVLAGAGVAPKNRTWDGYVIFPIVEWGRVVYYQGRTMIDPYGGSTKLFPSRNEFPRGSRYWLYNIDELRSRGGIVVLVESILNVLSLRRELAARELDDYYIPVAVFRHKLSPEQLAKLTRCRGITEVVFLYDADATASADKEASSIAGRFPRVSVADMPEGDANDNAALAVDRILERRPPDTLSVPGG